MYVSMGSWIGCTGCSSSLWAKTAHIGGRLKHLTGCLSLLLTKTALVGCAQVVGDLAQFMVQNNLTEASIVDQADQLSIPNR